jgi:hypothetical protein
MALTRLPEANQKLGAPDAPISELRIRLQYLLRDMAQLINATAEGQFAAAYNAQPNAPTGTAQAYNVGDFIPNSNITTYGYPGARYVARGWRCITAGAPGVWVQVQEPVDIPTGLQTYTPTIRPSTGAFTSASAGGSYLQLGKIVFVTITVYITTNGTGSGWVIASLPTSVANLNETILSGREIAAFGKSLNTFSSSATEVGIVNYDNTYPGGNGFILVVSGWYEAA